MKLKCVIIDDEPIARKILEEFIEEISFLELTGKAENPVKAAALLLDNPVDLIFLDINMPKLNGLDFLRQSKDLPDVIMTTAYPEYAVDGFTLDVLDYLVKPISFERFLKACEKAYHYHRLKKGGSAIDKDNEDYFFIKCDNAIEKVNYEDLLLVEGMMNYVTLHTTSRKMIVYMTIKSMLEQLPADRFLKVQKSYIVNLEAVKSIEGNMLSVGNEKITIGQGFREEVMKRVVGDRMIKRT